LDALKTDGLFDHWPLGGAGRSTDRGVELLIKYISEWKPEMFETLQRDYRRLFIGPDHLPAPPWESVYLSTDGLVFEEQTLAVRKFYARYGLESPKRLKEPDDHFGLELAFLAHLCTLGLEAISTNDPDSLAEVLDDQRLFLEQHLLLWGSEFLDRVVEHAETSYYRGAAHLASGSVEFIAAFVGAEVEKDT
jgi:TorA maturation chaperone TorD